MPSIEPYIEPRESTCCTCKRSIELKYFSEKKTRELLNRLRHDPLARTEHTAKGLICCMSCGAQATELKCNDCHEMLPFSAFSKAQRKKPDDAVCWDCHRKSQAAMDAAVAVTSENNSRAHKSFSKASSGRWAKPVRAKPAPLAFQPADDDEDPFISTKESLAAKQMTPVAEEDSDTDS